MPTTVTDKHGNAVTRHVLPSSQAGATGTSIPAPRAAAPHQTLANKYRDLIPDTGFDLEVNDKFARIDEDVLDGVKALIRGNHKWEYPTKRMLSVLYGNGTPAKHYEMRLRHLLTVANIAEQVQERKFIVGGTTSERSLIESWRLLNRWGNQEWDSAARERTEGCVLLFAISGDLKNGTQGVIRSDAEWIGARATAIIPLVPLLKERRAMTPNAIQPILDVAHPALAEGAL